MYHTEGGNMQYYAPIEEKSAERPNEVEPKRRTVRLMSRRYALTASGSKYLEIGINVGPPSYVEIVIGDNRGNELSLSLESWKALYEQRWNILGGLRDNKTSPISIGPLLTARFTRLENVKLARLDAANGVCMMATEPTLRKMFRLDRCVDVLFARMQSITNTVDTKYAQFASSVDKSVIRHGGFFNENEILDCELLSLVFEM